MCANTGLYTRDVKGRYSTKKGRPHIIPAGYDGYPTPPYDPMGTSTVALWIHFRRLFTAFLGPTDDLCPLTPTLVHLTLLLRGWADIEATYPPR